MVINDMLQNLTASDLEHYLNAYKMFAIEDTKNDDTPMFFSTLGLDRHGSGHELELVLPILPFVASQIILGIAKDIIDEEKCYEDGEALSLYEEDDAKIKIMPSYDGSGDLVYRIVMKDENGKFPDHKECEPPYSFQENIYVKE